MWFAHGDQLISHLTPPRTRKDRIFRMIVYNGARTTETRLLTKKNINKYTNTAQQYTRYKTPRRPYLYLCMRCDAPIIGSNYADRSMNLLAPISAITYNHAINYTIHGQWPRMDLN